MIARRFLLAGAAFVMVACGASLPPNATFTSGRFVDSASRSAFRVPDGWQLASPSSGDLVRVDSRDGELEAGLGSVELGASSCEKGLASWLASSRAAKATSTLPFVVETTSEPLPAWRGEVSLSDGRQGRFAGFCWGSQAIGLIVVARPEALRRRSKDVAAVVESLSYAAPGESLVALEPRQPKAFEHEIRWRGQTLSRIAKWYTGAARNWKKLTTPVNPDLTKCCVPLRVGRVVRIPRDLVIREDPLPKPRSRPKALTVEEKPTADEEPTADEVAGPEKPDPPVIIGPTEWPEPPVAPPETGGVAPADPDPPPPARPLPPVIGPK